MERNPLTAWMVAVLLGGTSAFAQGPGVLGRNNAEFARLLFEQGYADLARDLCRTIEENGGSAPELLAVKALEFDLQVAEIRQETDLLARKQALRAVIDQENAFIQENARTNVADIVRANLPGVYLELATTLTAALNREQDPARRAELAQEGQALFDEAKQNLRERVERFSKMIEEGGGNLDYALRQHQIASFNLAKMDYQHSLLHPQGSPERKALVEAALTGFKDFGFEYPDSLQNYQGIIYQGLCHESLGQTDDALIDYEDAFALRDLFVVDEKGVFEVGPDEADLLSGASLRRVELLTRLRRHPEAILAAEEFLRTIPDPLLCSSGPEVLAAKAQAEIGSGDIAGASATAQLLVDFDPQGRWGSRGRELLGALPVQHLSPDKILSIADTTARRGDFSRALDLCRRAREVVRGARDEQEIGASSFLLCGRIYAWQNRLHEASVAYDLAAELYPRSSRAPEALNLSVNAYRELAKRDRSRFYSERANERMNALATRYPQHPLAANAGIWQGLRREDDGDHAGAIEFYEKVSESSPSYHEASFRLANATYQQAKSLIQEEKRDEAAALLARAEEQYKRSLELLRAAQEATLDTAVQQRLGNYAFSARLGLAMLLIDLGKPAEVLPLLEGQEAKVGNDPDMVAALWSLRIRALQADGKVDEALALFESLLQKTPDAPEVASAAGVLARALDQSAVDLFEQEPGSERAEFLWQKAAFFYALSVKSALAGDVPLRADDVVEIAQRLYVIGLFFNQVPEGQGTFVDWQGEVQAPEMWEAAAQIYERLDAQAPSYRVSIERARTLAILGRMDEAETIYARLFDQVSLFAPGDTSQRFERSVIEARPELVPAYLEWGVATHLVGLENDDQSRLERAGEIYNRMLTNTTSSMRQWWQAKYFQIKLLSDSGKYDAADVAVKNVKRTTDPQYDKGEFGFKDKFLGLEAELSKKVFSNPKKPR